MSRVISTAYGRPALTELRTLVAEVKHNDAMAPVTVLVPNDIAGVVARRHLAAGLTDDCPGVAAVYIGTVSRLAEQLTAAELAPRRPATRAITTSACRRLLDDDAGMFEDVKQHPATITALLRAHRELRDLDDAALDPIADTAPLAADVVSLHRRLVASLQPRFYDETDLLAAAQDRCTRNAASLAELGHVVLYLPQDLRRTETALIQALAEHVQLTVIRALTGEARADRATAWLLADLGSTSPATPRLEARATSVLHATDSDEEVRCVVRRVTSDLQSTPAQRIAILYAGASPYARLVHEQLTNAGIQFSGPGSRPVVERALAQGALGLLGATVADFPRAEVFQALSSAPVRTFSGGWVPVSRWDRISRSAAVVGGEDWDVRLSNFIERQQAGVRAQSTHEEPSQSMIFGIERDAENALRLHTFMYNLRTAADKASHLTSWANLSQGLLEAFETLYGTDERLRRLPPEEQQAAAAVERALNAAGTLDEFEPGTASLSAMHEVLTGELEASLPGVGRFGDGVFVGPLSAAVGLDVDRLYLLGLAEDGYPGRTQPDALLSDEVRAASDGALRSDDDRIATLHRHLLAAFDAAPEVVACFPRGDLRRSVQRLPSRFLLPTLRRLAGVDDLVATEWQTVHSRAIVSAASYATELERSDVFATEQEWRVRARRSGLEVTDPVIASASAMISARASDAFTRFDGNLSGLPRLPDYAHSVVPVSPTALEAYADCPHTYFIRRMLLVEPVEQPEEIVTLSPIEVGNLMHEAIDTVITEHIGKLPSYGEPWTSDHRRRLQEIARHLGVSYERRGITGHPRLWQAEQKRILRDLDRMLVDDSAWRAGLDAAVLASEMAFGLAGKEPVRLDISGGSIALRGKADKVDQTSSGTLLVTDIKTGSDSAFRQLKRDPVAGGTKLQLPVYAYAARQRFGGTAVQARYWFVRRKPSSIQLVLDGDLDQTYRAALGVLVNSIAAGLFPAKPPKSPDYLWVQCAYCNPDGVGYGDLPDRWRRKRTDVLLAQLVALIDPQAAQS